MVPTMVHVYSVYHGTIGTMGAMYQVVAGLHQTFPLLLQMVHVHYVRTYYTCTYTYWYTYPGNIISKTYHGAQPGRPPVEPADAD